MAARLSSLDLDDNFAPARLTSIHQEILYQIAPPQGPSSRVKETSPQQRHCDIKAVRISIARKGVPPRPSPATSSGTLRSMRCQWASFHPGSRFPSWRRRRGEPDMGEDPFVGVLSEESRDSCCSRDNVEVLLGQSCARGHTVFCVPLGSSSSLKSICGAERTYRPSHS